MRPELAEGLRYVLGNRYLRCDRGLDRDVQLLRQHDGRDLPRLRRPRARHVGAGTIGLIFAVGEPRLPARRALANRICGAIGVGPTIVVGAACSRLACCSSRSRRSRTRSRSSIAAAARSSASASVVYNVTQVSFRQAITPERLQGRMNSVMRFIVWGVMPLGTLLGGALAHQVRPADGDLGRRDRARRSPFLPVLLSPVRTLREMPEPVDEPLPRRRTRPAGCCRRPRGRSRPPRTEPAPRYGSWHARATRGGGVAARARPARVRLPGPAGRAGAHRDAEDVRPAAAGARRAAVRGRRPAREVAALPDRRR